jgi:hypothetical protein
MSQIRLPSNSPPCSAVVENSGEINQCYLCQQLTVSRITIPTMFSGQTPVGAAPSEADMSTSASIFGHTFPGVIPAQAQGSTSPNLKAHSLAGVTRQQILMNIMALCSQTNDHATVESRLDSMTMLVSQMAQLLLMEHSSSTGSSLSWVTTSSSGSNSAVATAGSAAVPRVPAVKLFRCPVCPSHKAPLTEKGFYKHVLAWKKLKTGRYPRGADNFHRRS